jgi:hypothetical protein
MAKPNLTVAQVEEAIGPLERYAHLCHGASLALVRSGLLPTGSRVARGGAKGVGAQHSWVVVTPKMGVYDQSNWVVDITLWSYVPEAPRLYIGKARQWPHTPKGSGHLRHAPAGRTGPVLGTDVELSSGARLFLDMWAPEGMDQRAWDILLGGPMQGWPSKEIVAAAYHTKALRHLVPIDIVGMVTDENPNNLYW